MSVRYVVRRGDSLWGLSGRYLGDFAKWPAIFKFHNDYVKQKGNSYNDLIPIADPT